MFVKAMQRNSETISGNDAYLNAIPAIATLETLSFEKNVTFLVGENGSGKSTLLEALAVGFSFNAEGGTKNFSFSTSDTHSGLHNYITLIKTAKRPRDGYFLRAESFYNAASYIDRLYEGEPVSSCYGGRSLHAQSHGESFLSLVLNRFGSNGFYILYEPEAALSPSRQLALMCRIHDLESSGSQFVIATHSPILMAYPDADLFLLDENGISKTDYKKTEHYLVTKRFLDDPRRMLKTMFSED